MNIYEYINTMCYEAFTSGMSQNYQCTESFKEFRLTQHKIDTLVSYECSFEDFFTTHFGHCSDQYTHLYIGALFAFSRETIQSRPKYFYTNLLRLNHVQTGELAHYLERCWYYIPQLNVNTKHEP